MGDKRSTRAEFNELVSLVKEIANHDMESCNQQKNIARKTVDQILIIVRTLQILIFIQALVISDIYLREKIINYLSLLVEPWSQLSEPWKIAVVTIISSVPIGILVTVVGWIIIEIIKGKRK